VTADQCRADAAPSAPDGLTHAVTHLLLSQDAEGYWEGEVAWNTMLLSQYVLTSRMVGRPRWSERDRDMILRHFEAARCTDGSWPLHSEAPGSLFVTVLAYVAVRILGVAPEEPMARGRAAVDASPGRQRGNPAVVGPDVAGDARTV
jgi:hypothetical protein